MKISKYMLSMGLVLAACSNTQEPINLGTEPNEVAQSEAKSELDLELLGLEDTSFREGATPIGDEKCKDGTPLTCEGLAQNHDKPICYVVNPKDPKDCKILACTIEVEIDPSTGKPTPVGKPFVVVAPGKVEDGKCKGTDDFSPL